MSWIHEMRRAAVRDYLLDRGLKMAVAEEKKTGVLNGARIVDAARIASVMLDAGHSAHRALEAGRAILEGRPWQ